MLLVDPKLLSLSKELTDLNLVKNLPSSISTVELDLFFKVIAILSSKILIEPLNTLDYDTTIQKIVAHLDNTSAQKLLLIEAKKIIQFIPANGMELEFIGAVKQIKRILMELSLDELLLLSKQRELSSTEKMQLQQILQNF